MKVGFCFLTYDKIHFENIWKKYFEAITNCDYEIIIHSKDPGICTTSLKNTHIIKKPIETTYADISLVKATLLMFKKALNLRCDYMFLLSGDCLPLTKFDHIKPKLTHSMFVMQQKDLLQEQKISFNLKNYNKLSSNFKQQICFQQFHKQNMFFGITKNDALVCLRYNYPIHFENLYAPDEYFFINILFINGINFVNDGFMLANSNFLTQTKSIEWNLTKTIIDKYSDRFMFIRKIKDLSRESEYYLLDKIS